MAKPDRVDTVSPGDLVVIFRQMDAGYRAAPLSALVDVLQGRVSEIGIPAGGTAGQVLAKIDAVDFNTEWVAQSGGGGSGNGYFPGGWT
jgi:hypothetical protein